MNAAVRALPRAPARGLAVALLAAATLLGGCAHVQGTLTSRDPWEGYNRSVFAFNEAIDEAAIKPAAEFYQKVVPGWLRSGVNNIFGNLGDLWSSVNLTLQAKPRAALEMGMRVATNTVFGIGGFFDVAEEAGLERASVEDFGQTLGRWGVKSGPYMVLPLLGPSTLRDSTGQLVDWRPTSPGLFLHEPKDRFAATGLQVLNLRVKLLAAGRVLDDVALDKYILMRDAYLARRRSLIYDGEPPEEDAQDAKPATP